MYDNNIELTKYIGTELYSSPEQLEGESYNHKSDLFSLGIIFFELCTLFDNHTDRRKKIKKLKEGKLNMKSVNINRSDSTIIKKLIHKNPQERLSLSKLINWIEKKLDK